MRPGTTWLFPYGRVVLLGPGEWEGRTLKGLTRVLPTLHEAHQYIKPIVT